MMERLYEVMMECICDKFCKYAGNECGEDTPCFLDDALREAVKKHFTDQE